MLIIPVKDGENIDRALKRYKRKFDRTKTMKNLRNRKQFKQTFSCKTRAKHKSSICSEIKNNRRARLIFSQNTLNR